MPNEPLAFIPIKDRDTDLYPTDQLYGDGQYPDQTQPRNTWGAMLREAIDNPYIREGVSKAGKKLSVEAQLQFKKRKNNNDRRNKTKLKAKQRNSSDENGPNGKSNTRGFGKMGSEEGTYAGGGPGKSHRSAPRKDGIEKIIWKSGIKAGLVNEATYASSKSTPMYLASGTLLWSSDAKLLENFPLFLELRNKIFPLYMQVISNRINRYAGDYVISKEWEQYILDVIKALQVYYCIDDILAYYSNNTPANVNLGMDHCRNLLSAEVVNEFMLLREQLERMVFPPNVVEFIRWACQTHRLSDAPHASVCKLNIMDMFTTPIDPTKDHTQKIRTIVHDVTVALTAGQNTKVLSFMHRAFPGWILGTMGPSLNNAYYDTSWFTLWHNLTHAHYEGTTQLWTYSREPMNEDSQISFRYFQDAEDLDGVVFACCSAYYDIEGTLHADKALYGLWNPWTILPENLDALPELKGETFSVKYFKYNSNDDPEFVAMSGTTDQLISEDSGLMYRSVYEPTEGDWSVVRHGVRGGIRALSFTSRLQREAFFNVVRTFFDPE